MRIIIKVQTRNGKVEIVCKLDEGNKDTPNETKAGTWLFDYIDMVLGKLQKQDCDDPRADADSPKGRKEQDDG